ATVRARLAPMVSPSNGMSDDPEAYDASGGVGAGSGRLDMADLQDRNGLAYDPACPPGHAVPEWPACSTRRSAPDGQLLASTPAASASNSVEASAASLGRSSSVGCW